MRNLKSLLVALFISIACNSLVAKENNKNEIIFDSLVAIIKSKPDFIKFLNGQVFSSKSEVELFNEILDLSYTDVLSKHEIKPEFEHELLKSISVTAEIASLYDGLNNRITSFDNSIDTTETYRIVEIDYSDFQEMELNLFGMTKEKFESYLSTEISDRYINDCSLGDLNLKSHSDCDQVCETYLTEFDSNDRMYLPADYDAGILGASFSPDCKNLIVYSTYDGPDYHNYYENRAEFYVFKIVGTHGLRSLQPTFKFSMKDWSIKNLVWINNNEIGLKLYSESRFGDGSQLDFKYFKADIQK